METLLKMDKNSGTILEIRQTVSRTYKKDCAIFCITIKTNNKDQKENAKSFKDSVDKLYEIFSKYKVSDIVNTSSIIRDFDYKFDENKNRIPYGYTTSQNFKLELSLDNNDIPNIEEEISIIDGLSYYISFNLKDKFKANDELLNLALEESKRQAENTMKFFNGKSVVCIKVSIDSQGSTEKEQIETTQMSFRASGINANSNGNYNPQDITLYKTIFTEWQVKY